jgi:phage-related protein
LIILVKALKKVVWINSSYKDFMSFPPEVKNAVGYILYCLQCGKKHEHLKNLIGMGNTRIAEIRENDSSGTYRVVFTVE